MRVGLVEGLQVLVVEARTLAELPVPSLEVPRRDRILDDGVDPSADLAHLLEVGVLESCQHVLGGELVRRQRHDPGPDPAGQVGPAVPDEVLLRHHHRGLCSGEVLEPALLPTRGGDLREPRGIGRPVVSNVH